MKSKLDRQHIGQPIDYRISLAWDRQVKNVQHICEGLTLALNNHQNLGIRTNSKNQLERA